VRSGGFDRAQIMTDGGIHRRLRHGWHALMTFEETLRPSPALVVAVPVEGGDEGKPLRCLETDGVYIGDEGEQRNDGLPRARQSEFVRLLGGINQVAAGIG